MVLQAFLKKSQKSRDKTLACVQRAYIGIVVLGSIVVVLVRGIGQWNRNNTSPVLTVEARVVTKRADVTMHHHGDVDQMHMHHSVTRYYVTFEVESGDRMEFEMPDTQYGLLVEGDRGKLTFQGTRYLSFARVNA